MILKTSTSKFNIASNITDNGVIWRNTNNNLVVVNSNNLSTSNDDVFCNVTDTNVKYSDILEITKFDFNIRPNATIAGIILKITASCSNTLLTKDTTISINNKTNKKLATTWNFARTTREYGSPTDNWGFSNGAELNDLHVKLKFEYLNNSYGNFTIHHVEVTVYYYEHEMYLNNRIRYQIKAANDCTQVGTDYYWNIPTIVYDNQFNSKFARVTVHNGWSNLLIFDNFDFSINSYNSVITGYSISIKGIYTGVIDEYYLKLNNYGTAITSQFLSNSSNFLTEYYINVGGDLNVLGQTQLPKYINTTPFSVCMKFKSNSECDIKINSVYCTVYYKRESAFRPILI